MEDLDWLLSAIMQSSAALVAIVGGFLITRLSGLPAKKAALDDEIESLEATWEDLTWEPIQTGTTLTVTGLEPGPEEQRKLLDRMVLMDMNIQAQSKATVRRKVLDSLPSEVTSGLWVVVGLALAGIICPAFLLAIGKSEVPASSGWLILTAFTVGILALLAYLLRLAGIFSEQETRSRERAWSAFRRIIRTAREVWKG